MNLAKWASRKFVVVETAMVLTFILAMYEKLTPTVGIVFAAAITAYHWANIQAAKNGVHDE